MLNTDLINIRCNYIGRWGGGAGSMYMVGWDEDGMKEQSSCPNLEFSDNYLIWFYSMWKYCQIEKYNLYYDTYGPVSQW